MSNNSTVKQRIPINRDLADTLITDSQSAISHGMNSFEEGLIADPSMMQDDAMLSRNPNQTVEQVRAKKNYLDEVNKDISTNDLEVPQEEQSEVVHQQSAQQAPQVSRPETNKEYNIRILREQKETAEARASQAENYIKHMQMANYQAPHNNQQRQQAAPQEESIQIDDDALIEGKQLKRYMNQVQQKYDKQLQQIQAQTQTQGAISQLSYEFKDFLNIASPENLKNLESIYPDDYRTVMSNPDTISAGRTLYRMIKNYGISDLNAVQNKHNTYEDADRRIQNNLAKPRTAARVGSMQDSTPLGRLNDYSSGRRILTESDKQKVRERLDASRRFSN